MTLQEDAEQELTELGFTDFLKPTLIETEDELQRQILDDLTLADKVKEDIDRIHRERYARKTGVRKARPHQSKEI